MWKQSDGVVASDDSANAPKETYECATEWGPRDRGLVGEANVTLTGRQDVDTHVTVVFYTEDRMRTMCRVRTGECRVETDPDQCTDYGHCCTLGE